MSLEDVMISLPNQMQRFNTVRITDEFGKEITASEFIPRWDDNEAKDL